MHRFWIRRRRRDVLPAAGPLLVLALAQDRKISKRDLDEIARIAEEEG